MTAHQPCTGAAQASRRPPSIFWVFRLSSGVGVASVGIYQACADTVLVSHGTGTHRGGRRGTARTAGDTAENPGGNKKRKMLRVDGMRSCASSPGPLRFLCVLCASVVH